MQIPAYTRQFTTLGAQALKSFKDCAIARNNCRLLYFGRFPSPCKERRLTIPCNGVDEVRMTAEDGSRRPRMTSVLYIGAPVITQPPYPFLHRTPPGKKWKSGPKYPENIGPQAKIFPQNIRSHIGYVLRLSGVLLQGYKRIQQPF